MRDRLMDAVSIEANTSCWLWTRSYNHKGYGRLMNRQAHRLSYAEFKGPIPSGMLVCHKCDTPACINPDHLFIGTGKDNMMDAAAKGRLGLQKRTHCANRHPFTEKNTVMITRRGIGIQRQCVICRLRWRYTIKSGLLADLLEQELKMETSQ